MVHTAKILITPMTRTTIPEAMTIRQNGRPRDWTLVAFLLRLPRTLIPKKHIEMPSMTKPDCWLKSGQLRETYLLNRGSSVRIRKPARVIVRQKVGNAGQARPTSYDDCDDMPACIEEVEFADYESLDQHDRASCYD